LNHPYEGLSWRRRQSVEEEAMSGGGGDEWEGDRERKEIKGEIFK
jgi:hypothetical protein